MGGGFHQHLCHACHLLPVGSSWRIDRQDSQPSPHHRHLETPVPLSHQLPPLHLALLEDRCSYMARLCHCLWHSVLQLTPPPIRPLSRLYAMDKLLRVTHSHLCPAICHHPVSVHARSKRHDTSGNQHHAEEQPNVLNGEISDKTCFASPKILLQ